ncbi:11 TM domain-containing transmembrane protein [Acrasis kona]|uniref:11 TM domain-containing transmembrane protein n=1 Tax=Acrasis kona TaxID=1008807 RepID=A0AAW2Z4Z7_9EUKA
MYEEYIPQAGIDAILPINNTTNIALVPHGGIGLTITLNLLISALLFALFVFVLRPCLPLFNIRKKRQLLKQVRKLDQMSYANRNTKPDEVSNAEPIDVTSAESEQAKRENRYKNLLDLSEDEDTEPELEDENSPAPAREQAASEQYSKDTKRALKRSVVIAKELLLMIKRVTLSFIFPKHDREDMKHLFSNYSRDVATYLGFQKAIITALLLCSIIALVILIPLHMTGVEPIHAYRYEYGSFNLTKEDYPLLRTSISMVDGSPGKMYVHVILIYLFVFIFGFCVYRFNTKDVVTRELFSDKIENDLDTQSSSSSTTKAPKRQITDYTVQISQLPSHLDNQIEFDRMVREELCTDLKVFKTVLVFDVHERIKLQEQYEEACNLLERYHYLNDRYNKRHRVFRYSTSCLFQFVYCGFFFWNPSRSTLHHHYIDAIEHYISKKKRLEIMMRDWERIYKRFLDGERSDETQTIKPCGHGYVIFESPTDAEKCYQQFAHLGTISRPIRCLIRNSSRNQKTTFECRKEIVKHVHFCVHRALEPADIHWNNMLTYKGGYDMIRNISIQVFLIIVFVFTTSPLAVVSAVQSLIDFSFVNETIRQVRSWSGNGGNVLFQYMPTFFLHLTSVLLPYVVWIVSDLAKYRSKSRYRRKLIFRMYVYLTLSTLLMPAALLTSFDAVINYLKNQKELEKMFNRMFLPASGAFFINYVLQTALLKNFEDIIRAFNIILYFWGIKSWPQVSPREKLSACELSEFYFEYEYPFYLSVMTMVMTYSVTSPVILFSGLWYILFKHLVDRYVIMYIYGHKKRFAANKGVLSFDFKSHQKQVRSINQLVIIMLTIFVASMTIFFSTRVRGTGAALLPHAIACGLLTLFLIGVNIAYFTSLNFRYWFKQKIYYPLKVRWTKQRGEDDADLGSDMDYVISEQRIPSNPIPPQNFLHTRTGSMINAANVPASPSNNLIDFMHKTGTDVLDKTRKKREREARRSKSFELPAWQNKENVLLVDNETGGIESSNPIRHQSSNLELSSVKKPEERSNRSYCEDEFTSMMFPSSGVSISPAVPVVNNNNIPSVHLSKRFRQAYEPPFKYLQILELGDRKLGASRATSMEAISLRQNQDLDEIHVE